MFHKATPAVMTRTVRWVWLAGGLVTEAARSSPPKKRMTPSTDNGNRRSSIVTEISVEQGHGEEQRPEDHQGPAIIQERGIGR